MSSKLHPLCFRCDSSMDQVEEGLSPDPGSLAGYYKCPRARCFNQPLLNPHTDSTRCVVCRKQAHVRTWGDVECANDKCSRYGRSEQLFYLKPYEVEESTGVEPKREWWCEGCREKIPYERIVAFPRIPGESTNPAMCPSCSCQIVEIDRESFKAWDDYLNEEIVAQIQRDEPFHGDTVTRLTFKFRHKARGSGDVKQILLDELPALQAFIEERLGFECEALVDGDQLVEPEDIEPPERYDKPFSHGDSQR